MTERMRRPARRLRARRGALLVGALVAPAGVAALALGVMAATAKTSRHGRGGMPPARKATPSLSTRASGPVTVGGPIADTATLLGAHGRPSADTVTFTVYAAFGGRSSSGHHGDGRGTDGDRDDDDRGEGCGTFVARLESTAGPNGTYTSRPFTSDHAGTYLWIASFSGDHENAAVAGRCGAPGETSTVEKAAPTVSTSPSAGVAVGERVWDRASLHGGLAPTGTVAFGLYRDRWCSRRVFGSIDALQRGSATSDAYRTHAAGTYYWRATYSGDRDNAAATTPCGPGHEVVVVAPRTAAYTIGGDVSVPLSPGAPAQAIDLTFRNPSRRGIRVARLTVAIASVTGGSNAPYPCTPADFLVAGYRGPYPFSVPPGTSSLSTILPSLPASAYPSIRMIDRRDALPGDGTGNQDGCEGATVHLVYRGLP